MRMTKKTTTKTVEEKMIVGIDLGTSRSAISASNGKQRWVESYVGWPKDFIARKVVGDSILFVKRPYLIDCPLICTVP